MERGRKRESERGKEGGRERERGEREREIVMFSVFLYKFLGTKEKGA